MPVPRQRLQRSSASTSAGLRRAGWIGSPSRSRDGNVMVDTAAVVEGPPRGVLEGPTEAAGPSCVTLAVSPRRRRRPRRRPRHDRDGARSGGRASLDATLADRRRVGLLVLVLSFPAYKLTESSRRSDARRCQHAAQLAPGNSSGATNCTSCHGVMGEGVSAPALNSQEFLHRSPTSRCGIIAGGIPGTAMPAWSTDYGGPLTEQQIQALVTYVRSWETTAPSGPDWRTPQGGVRHAIGACACAIPSERLGSSSSCTGCLQSGAGSATPSR